MKVPLDGEPGNRIWGQLEDHEFSVPGRSLNLPGGFICKTKGLDMISEPFPALSVLIYEDFGP